MRITLLTIFIVFTGTVFSQEDSITRKPKTDYKCIQHELEVDPVSVWFNEGFSLGHRLKYTYSPNHLRSISLETNGTLLNSLDNRARYKNIEGTFPKLNRTQLIYEHSRPIRQCKLKKFALSSLGFRAGYHYFQHATGSGHMNYWVIDSTTTPELRRIAGFRSHSLLLGFSMDFDSFRRGKNRTRRSSHRISIDYLFSPYYQLKIYNSGVPSDPNPRTVESFLPFSRSGGQFTYSFKREFSPNFGLHVDLEAVWVPFLKDYQPNYDYFVWRGSESISPLFLNAPAGIYWKF